MQFALHPDSFRYAVIEVNPRVSRSSALASKATGYPIAKVATKIAIGYGLDEIINTVTGKTYAFFEPVLDYCVIKIPKFPFDKFVYAKRKPGTQMKATGEIMSIGMSMKPYERDCSIELGMDTLRLNEYAKLPLRKIREKMEEEDDTRIFAVYEALYRGITIESIQAITGIDPFFLNVILNLARMEAKVQFEELTEELYLTAKKMGFLDSTIQRLSGQDLPCAVMPSIKPLTLARRNLTPRLLITINHEISSSEKRREKDPYHRLRPHPHRSRHRIRLLLRTSGLGSKRARI